MLLSLQESPLKFKLKAIGVLNLLHLLLNRRQFLNYHCKIIVFNHIVAIDLTGWPWKPNLSDNIYLQLAL